MFRREVVLLGLFILSILLAGLLTPRPAGIEAGQWNTLVLFSGTILVVLWNRFPIAMIVLLSLSVGMGLHLLTVRQALYGYSSSVTWIIVAAFVFARSFQKTGLGRRIALKLIGALGSSSLRLGYALALTDFLLAPVTASNTARAGGIIFPIARSLALEFDSHPGKNPRRLGAYLLFTAFQANVVTSSIFLTAMAANGLSVQLAASAAGVQITWPLWFKAACLPGLTSLLLVPWLIFLLYPPEVRRTPEAARFAHNELLRLGPMSREEKILATTFLVLALVWGSAGWHGVSAIAAAFAAIFLLFATSVLGEEDVTGEPSAWQTLIWFGGFVSLAGAVSDSGLIPLLSSHLESLCGFWSPIPTLVLMVVVYFYLHYAFASMTAQIIALYAAFLTVAISCGAPALLSSLIFAFVSSLYGCLTHYGDGAAPIFFGAGYIELKHWWMNGFALSLLHLSVWLGVGLPWWKILGLW